MILAEPVSQPPSFRHSFNRPRPAALWIAPSTPPPPSSDLLAALTIASTARVVMSPRMRPIRSLRDWDGAGEASAGFEVGGMSFLVL